jgi:hypothetical protein
MTEAQSAEQLRLLQQEIVLAGEAVETLKRDQRAAIAALCTCSHHCGHMWEEILPHPCI